MCWSQKGGGRISALPEFILTRELRHSATYKSQDPQWITAPKQGNTLLLWARVGTRGKGRWKRLGDLALVCLFGQPMCWQKGRWSTSLVTGHGFPMMEKSAKSLLTSWREWSACTIIKWRVCMTTKLVNTQFSAPTTQSPGPMKKARWFGFGVSFWPANVLAERQVKHQPCHRARVSNDGKKCEVPFNKLKGVECIYIFLDIYMYIYVHVFYMYYYKYDHMFVFALTINMISTTHNCLYLHSIVYMLYGYSSYYQNYVYMFLSWRYLALLLKHTAPPGSVKTQT